MTQSVASTIFSPGLGESFPIASIRPCASTLRSGPALRAWGPERPVMIAVALRISISDFMFDFRFVPVAEGELRKKDHQEEEQHAGHGDEEERGEEARDVDREPGLQDLVGEPG